ncbi:hypothetical protein Tco_0723255 [Tanacetum coccineum]
MAQQKEMKRLANLKAKKEKSKKLLKKILNPATIRAQTQKMAEHEAKRQKKLDEFNRQISFRADQLLIIKISYVVNSNKEATMKITRGDNPLNLIVCPNFRLKMLGFSEWLRVHALASKKSGKSNEMLLQSLRAKFQWVIDQEKKLGLLIPPTLTTFGITTKDKKRKTTEFLKEVFVTENIIVNGMQRNLIPPRVMPIEGLVISKPKSGIFFMNRIIDIAFQRETKFHLTPTVQLIQIQNQIKGDSKIADEMFRKMIYVIEARSNCIEARKIVEKNLEVMKGLSECKASKSNIRHIQVKDIVKEFEDYLKTYSSAGIDISWDISLDLTSSNITLVKTSSSLHSLLKSQQFLSYHA